MYSINVFVTFTLSQLGMYAIGGGAAEQRHWLRACS